MFQVIQQQQLLQTKQSSVLFNPETQTKIVYRVVYPSAIHRGGKSTRRPRHVIDGTDGENSRKEHATSGTAKKIRRQRRTRSGRVCRPPQYIVKDYKQIHVVDHEPESSDVVGPGYSDFKESSEDEANTGDDQVLNKPFDSGESIPTGE